MQRYRFSWAMFIGAALTVGQPLWAGDDKPSAAPNPDQLFKELDKNSDGQLSADEVGEDRKRFFDRLVRVGDQDADGKLSLAEFQKAAKADMRPVEPGREDNVRGGGRPNPEEMFKRFDVNGDGKITRSEIPERAKVFLGPLFDRLGKDELTKDDISNARERLSGQGRAIGGRNGNAGNGIPEEFFKRLDTNNDGKLTLDEAPERGRPFVERMLKTLDKGTDGVISKEEFLAAAARIPAVGPGARGDRRRTEGERPEGSPRDGDRRPEGTPREGDRKPEGERRPGLPRFFNKLDTNRDGQISVDEFAKASELFQELDENGDGQLDPRELLGPPPIGGRDGGGDRGSRNRRPAGEGPDRPAEGGRPEQDQSSK